LGKKVTSHFLNEQINIWIISCLVCNIWALLLPPLNVSLISMPGKGI
jgi:hypothetical protein